MITEMSGSAQKTERGEVRCGSLAAYRLLTFVMVGFLLVLNADAARAEITRILFLFELNVTGACWSDAGYMEEPEFLCTGDQICDEAADECVPKPECTNDDQCGECQKCEDEKCVAECPAKICDAEGNCPEKCDPECDKDECLACLDGECDSTLDACEDCKNGKPTDSCKDDLANCLVCDETSCEQEKECDCKNPKIGFRKTTVTVEDKKPTGNTKVEVKIYWSGKPGDGVAKTKKVTKCEFVLKKTTHTEIIWECPDGTRDNDEFDRTETSDPYWEECG